MAGSDFYDRFVPLGQHCTGPIIPMDCYRLYLELGERGFTLSTEDDHKVLVVNPPEALTDADCARLRRWRWHLLMLLDYFCKPDFDAPEARP